MNMQVKIYMSDDNKELIYDNDQLQEFKNLVSELGLSCDNRIDPEKSPIPYIQLDPATVRAFKLICPQVNRIENYPHEIPLEVLRQVKLSNHEKYFDWIEIWSTAKDPDPFAVGMVYKNQSDREKNYTWNVTPYLIGRWGAESKEISELIIQAEKIAADRIRMYAQATIAKMKSWYECPDVWAIQYIRNNDTEASSALNGNSLPF